MAISRAFGDFDCKNVEMNAIEEIDGTSDVKVTRNFISSEPEIRMVEINPQTDDFLILASDGLYDRFTSKEVVELIRDKLSKMNIME